MEASADRKDVIVVKERKIDKEVVALTEVLGSDSLHREYWAWKEKTIHSNLSADNVSQPF